MSNVICGNYPVGPYVKSFNGAVSPKAVLKSGLGEGILDKAAQTAEAEAAGEDGSIANAQASNSVGSSITYSGGDELVWEEIGGQPEKDSMAETEMGQPEEEQSVKAEEEPSKEDSSEEKMGGKVSFNAEKRSRQLASAQTPEQVRTVMALLSKDLSDCKAGLQKGWCDKAEVMKVEAMIQRARNRIAQVAGNEEEPGSGAFELNMLI